MDTSTAYTYPVTKQQYAILVARCGSRCEMCGMQAGGLWVDHDHETNLVRGLLCISCNSYLGQRRDNLDALSAWFLRKVEFGITLEDYEVERFLEAVQYLTSRR